MNEVSERVKLLDWAAWLPVGAVVFEVADGIYYRTEYDAYYTEPRRLVPCSDPPKGIPVYRVDKSRL